jgi:hypothetical protein
MSIANVLREIPDLVRTARVRHLQAEHIVTAHGAKTREQFALALARTEGVLPVVIPAHNEATDLPRTLLTIARTGNVHPVVVTNRCSDRTAEFATSMGATVIDAPTGRKMGATQAGLAYAAHELGANRVLFTDGDTLAPPKWGTAMDARLRQADTGAGAAVFANGLAWHGPSVMADAIVSAGKVRTANKRERAGGNPIAQGYNYGVSLDAEGRVEASIMGLDAELFASQSGGNPDDAAIMAAIQETDATVTGLTAPESWVVTRGDRLTTVTQAIAVVVRHQPYAEVVSASYTEQYGM